MSAPSEDGDDRVVEEIYDALDAGAPERAYAAARIALTRSPDDPVLHFLAGTALLDLDQPEDAAAALARAVTLDPEDAEFRAMHAQALFAACAFGRARAEAERAVAIDQASADGRYVRAMVLEREGRQDEADREYREASRLAPDRLTMSTRMTRDAFEEAVARAAAILPRAFRERLDEVGVVVEEVPPEAILLEENPALDPELLGLFVGTALPERTFASAGVEPPPRILLFQRNLERIASDRAELEREIARTLHHELAHYLGFAEDQMADLDLD